MTEERFWILFASSLTCEIEPEESAKVDEYLRQHPELRQKASTLKEIWNSKANHASSYKETAFNKHMQRLSNHFSEPVLQYEAEPTDEAELIEKKERKPFIQRRLVWITGIAASFLIIFFAFFYSPLKNDNSSHKAQNTVSTKRGSKSKIQLPDGTQVWLNADSKITYNENFQGKLREVQLTGEAFFDVVRDETRPFIIHTNVLDVKVLGTAFNVRSYADEKNTETSLIRGSVEITLHSSPDKKFTLKPNDKLVVNNNEAKGKTEKAVLGKLPVKENLLTLGRINYQKSDSSALETLWIKNKLAFDKESLEEIALKIERWYDVKVKIADDRIKKTEFSAVFDDESLQQVMEALHITGDFHYVINKKEVTIRQ